MRKTRDRVVNRPAVPAYSADACELSGLVRAPYFTGQLRRIVNDCANVTFDFLAVFRSR